MSCAAVDPFAWLPPHLRSAGERWAFGLRPGATWCVFSIRGALWYGDGACLVSSGLPAHGPQSATARLLEEYLDTAAGELAIPVVRGGPVRVGDAWIPEAHHGLVAELFPGATWSNPLWWSDWERDAVPAALARCDGEAVALVLPLTGSLDKV
jgi:hypothetical protein